MYSYLKDRKQYVQINNEQGEFDTIISSYPKAQFLDQFYLIFFVNDFFSFIPKASVHNFADDNTLASFESALEEVHPILESEGEATINWLHSYKIIITPTTFPVIPLDKRDTDNTNIELK